MPGLTVSGARGISSLPAIHGLADDRLRVQVDGADLMPACPNHMNAPLSYADPARVDSVKVFSGATPVSVAGDSLGGSVQVRSRPPEFATPAEGVIARGSVGGFVRSNGGAMPKPELAPLLLLRACLNDQPRRQPTRACRELD